jgi:hypothetical protein
LLPAPATQNIRPCSSTCPRRGRALRGSVKRWWRVALESQRSNQPEIRDIKSLVSERKTEFDEGAGADFRRVALARAGDLENLFGNQFFDCVRLILWPQQLEGGIIREHKPGNLVGAECGLSNETL